jgi:hypothetical protein
MSKPPVRSSRENYNAYQRELMRRRRAAKSTVTVVAVQTDLEDAILWAKGRADWLRHNQVEAMLLVLAAFNTLPERERKAIILRRSLRRSGGAFGKQLSDAVRLMEENSALFNALHGDIDAILAIFKARPPPGRSRAFTMRCPVRWRLADSARPS